eukprot:TRINITY_DN11749_c0_g1_i2.p1 TRINITY_DN11749_c0_g1~~TRINITY_DN11749_c0_g1_i2.p1  ORF type:complete len:395 (-),score=93.72 TRINITY_DN11749_c0_g1_i2:31-1140(-)
MSPATAAPLVVRGLAQAASGSGHAAASKAASPVASVVPLAVPAGVAGGGSAERLAPLATLGRGLGASAASRQRRPRRLRRGVIGVAVAAFAATSAVLYLRRILAAPAALTVPARAAPVARTVASTPQASGTSADAALAQLATAALARIEPLAQQVSSGGIIANFGKEAERLLHDLEEEALSEVDGASATALVSAVDGALNSLFLQQLELLRARVAARFQASSADAPETAEARFLREAAPLARPGWSVEADRLVLRRALRGKAHREIKLIEERRRAEQTQRASRDVIRHLQRQLDSLGESLRGMGGASPWMLWTSYVIPNTPLRVTGRYTKGRANIELDLQPSKDPANADAGFVESPFPKNIGMSLNLGL